MTDLDRASAERRRVLMSLPRWQCHKIVRAAKILALMKGRYNVAFSDLKEAALPALRHRMILNFEAEAEGIRADTILEKILAEIPEVAERR